MKRKFGPWQTALAAFACLCVFTVFLAAIPVAFLYHKGLFDPPDFSLLNDRRETSKFYDASGKMIKEYCVYCRESATIEEMGGFPDLAVAAEDKNFRKRSLPVSLKSILRAAWEDIKSGELKQGGSTIEQQTRIVFARKELKEEKTSENKVRAKFWRKARETWIAYRLVKKFPREKILELYLNNVHCGAGRYGVKACSEYYFGKRPRDLNVAEAALIIGLWRNPKFSPFEKPTAAKKLRDRVIAQIERAGLVTEEEKRAWENFPLPKRRPERKDVLHFAEFVRREVTEDRRLVDQGLKVRTTVRSDWQKVASRALEKSLDSMKKRNPELSDLRGAAIVIDAKTGAIKVWAQEPGFEKNQYLLNQIRRHCGSSCKPFEYAALLERGWRLSSEDEGEGPCMLDDSHGIAVPMGGGKFHYPHNFPYRFQPRYRGMIPALEALAESRNLATMSAVQGVKKSRVPENERVSKEDIIGVMERLGIPNPLKRHPPVDPGLTVGLGSIDVSPLEMARAVTGFLGGMAEPYAIEKIETADGEIVSPEHKQPKSVFDEKISLEIIRGLRATVELQTGTAARARRELDFQIAGKTGTATNWAGETTDNWFWGATPSYCVVVWIGREKKTAIKTTIAKNGEEIQETGGRNALPVAIEIMKAIYGGRRKEAFPEATDPLKPFAYAQTDEK